MSYHLRELYMRHRVSINDLGVIVAAILVLIFVAYEVDIFANEASVTVRQETIELDEVLLLGGCLAVGLLGFSVRRYIEQKREMNRRVEAERYARQLAFQDPLTGLANRRQFDDALRVAIASPPAAGAAHALLMLDLNGFKKINDSFGHGIGDELLVIVAQRLSAAMRPGDLIARLGGDEFAVLALHVSGPEAASNIAHRIVQALSEPVTIAQSQHHIGTGIGIALLPSDAQTAQEGIRKADVALYRAKAEHRSATRFFEEQMDVVLREREEMERHLRAAMASDLIYPRFRPSFDLLGGSVAAFEAIPSWLLSGAAEVPVERLVAIAEESGLIHAIGESVLRKACLAARSWPAHTKLSIDIYPGQLSDPSFGATTLAVLHETGFDPARLEVEIAESMLVRELDAAKVALAPLRQAGVTVTLDHFGTGYSSLYHMNEFKIDKVKIDRRFAEHLDGQDADRMVRALAGFGHGLGLLVSAEGSSDLMGQVSLLSSGVQQNQPVSEPISSEDALAMSFADLHVSPRSGS